ncbi:MAG: DNA double-strand break repair nuclease NurA [Candidatus Melainabacteria bacterium]|nr:DNA double-strand break repair nuclease NurA [Candidatus Melainabacteria bacterium]
MLDLQKLIVQINEVGSDSLRDRTELDKILNAAGQAYDEASQNADLFAGKLLANRQLVYWPVAMPLEPFGFVAQIEQRVSPVTVVATDGSQIMPSHHEIHNCYLLNIGMTLISYGVKLPPVLASEPRLYHRVQDLYPLVNRRRIHIDELYVSLERHLLELETLFNLSVRACERKLPVVAFLDGTLIPWSVEKMPETYQTVFLERSVATLAAFEAARIPLVGYLSQARSSDLVNNLRVWKCPYGECNCQEFCGNLNEEDFPCSQICPLADRQLLAGTLPVGYRSSTFLSGAKVVRTYPKSLATSFVYLNVGREIARLEFPQWLAYDKQTLELTLATTLSQVNKADGYPVCLAEAHNLAVIRSQDRKGFFELLARHLVSLGVDRVSLSPKETRKRRAII